MSFDRDVAKWGKKVRNLMDRTSQKLVKEGYFALLRRSPIKTGRFRASHRVGVGAMDTTVEPVRKGLSPLSIGANPTTAEIAYITEAVRKIRFGTVTYLSNSLPYARRLELGYSKQNLNKVDGIYGDTLRELAARAPFHIATVRKEGIGATDISIFRV